MSLFRRIRDAAVCVVLLVLPFFFLRANLRDPAQTNVVDRVILQASAPLQYAATELAQGASGILQEYVYLVDVKRDNDRLRAENARLRESNRRLASHAIENRRLRRLLQLREQLRGTLLSAQVIGKEPAPPFRVVRVRLDRGERDRVRPGMPVLTADGLVGRILRAWGRYSDVLLMVDPGSAVDVVVERSGARGMLKGSGDDAHYECRLEKVAREDDIVVGDTLVTSGLGQLFPAGIVVGRIEKVEKAGVGLYQEASVVPSVDFSRVEEVLILTEGPRAHGVEDATPTGAR